MAELLYEAITQERSRLFVGREDELAALERWLDDPKAPTAVISVTGMGGVGKSTLLLQMQELARGRDVASVWVDGRACGHTPAGFLSYLGAVMSPESQRPSSGDGLQGLVPRSNARSLWCIDNFEELEPIDGWLRERFFAAFPAEGQLVVLASRQRLVERWREDPGWKRRLRHFPLEPLGRGESRKYLGRAGVAASMIDDLVRRTGGLPLALSLAADAYDRRPQAIEANESDLLLSVNARLLRETAGGELQPLLDLLSIVPEADAGLISHVFGEPIATERLASLARLSFVQSSRSGFRLHDVARHFLLAELQQRDNNHFRRLRRLAVLALLRRLESAPAERAPTLAGTLLAVCADTLPSVETYANLSSLPSAMIRAAHTDDLPQLHRLADQWGSQPFLFCRTEAHHRLLDRVVKGFPEACRVMCAPDGRLLGMFVALLLWRDTARCIEAIEPGALARHLPEEHAQMAGLPPEKADTYIAVMVGADPGNEEFSLQEIVGVLIRDGLARLGNGTRALLGTNHRALVLLLDRLGFQLYKQGPHALTFGGMPWTLYELDHRSGRFGAWVMAFLDAVDGQDRFLLRSEAFTVSDLRTLLADFNDAAAWERSPVPAAVSLDPGELRTKLKEVLMDGGPLPPPLMDRDREALLQTFILRRPPEVVAANLHVSRATYYRHLQRALERLRDALVNAFGG